MLQEGSQLRHGEELPGSPGGVWRAKPGFFESKRLRLPEGPGGFHLRQTGFLLLYAKKKTDGRTLGVLMCDLPFEHGCLLPGLK